MRLLVRKIQKSKWMQNDILNGEPVSGDAITNCLKTKNNTGFIAFLKACLML